MPECPSLDPDAITQKVRGRGLWIGLSNSQQLLFFIARDGDAPFVWNFLAIRDEVTVHSSSPSKELPIVSLTLNPFGLKWKFWRSVLRS